MNNSTVTATITNIATTLTSGINAEVNTLRDEANNRIGRSQAMQEWTNTNLGNMPVLVTGDVAIDYKDDRSNMAQKEESKNEVLWLITLQLTEYLGHINGSILANSFVSWAKDELDKEWNIESAKRVAINYIKSMQGQAIIDTEIVSVDVRHPESGQMYKVKASLLSSEFKDELNTQAEQMRTRTSMVCKPLTNQPEDWVSTTQGVGEFANMRLITGQKVRTKTVAPDVLSAVNKLQAVRFVVHPAMIKAASEQRINQHKYAPKAGATAHAKNSWANTMEMYAEIRQYAKGSYFFPVTMDTRGRMYYRGGRLTPQGTDFCKAAFQFAESKPLGEHGYKAMCLHTANMFGMDKVSIDERVQWVQDNSMNLSHIKSHVDVMENFKGANVFQATVAALELKKVWARGGSIKLEDFESNLVCHQDGTCNGLQHMAAITGDRATAIAVNCVASNHDDQPSDIYGIIAQHASENTTDSVHALIVKHGRDMAKNPVMITGYGAGDKTVIKNTAAYLYEKEFTPVHSKQIGGAYLEAITTNAGAVKQLTESVKMCVEDALAAGKTKFTWKTADGFIACTEYRSDEANRVRAGQYNAKKRGFKAPLDMIKSVGAMAPNFVHSIDATHLRMVINDCNHDLVTVHDSIGSHAATYFDTARSVREKFVEVHAYDALTDLCNNMGTMRPEFDGDYKAEEALQSSYIFS